MGYKNFDKALLHCMSALWSLSVAQRTLLKSCVAQARQPVPCDWVEFRLAGDMIGQLPVAHARALANKLQDCALSSTTLEWHAAALTAEERSVLIEHAAQQLRDAGLIVGWRNEQYACYGEWADSPDVDLPQTELFRLERAAFRYFGLRSRAVHINGFRRDGHLWIGRRSEDKAIDPGQLDNLAAGGLPADESAECCAVRELWEEAGIESPLARAIRPSGLVTARRVVSEGLHHEDLMTFDLEVPEQVTPKNIDGEVSAFYCLPLQAVIDAIREQAFTGDAAVVTARFLLNHSLDL